MTAKEYLSQVRWLNQQILNCNDEIKQLRELAETIKATNYEQSVVQTSGKPDAAFACVIEKIADSEVQLSETVESYLEFRKTIKEEIRQLPEAEERILLEKRYVCLKSWSAVADEMGYVRRHITRIHADALQNFEKIHAKKLKMSQNVLECPT